MKIIFYDCKIRHGIWYLKDRGFLMGWQVRVWPTDSLEIKHFHWFHPSANILRSPNLFLSFFLDIPSWSPPYGHQSDVEKVAIGGCVSNYWKKRQNIAIYSLSGGLKYTINSPIPFCSIQRGVISELLWGGDCYWVLWQFSCFAWTNEDSFELRKKPSYFSLYWLFNTDPYNGLL